MRTDVKGMGKIHYKTLWIETGAKDNGVAYPTFYNRVRWKKESPEEASRPPENQRARGKLSCLAGEERDSNSVGFRPLLGDGDRLNEIMGAQYPRDTKQDLMALMLREWLDEHEAKPS
jgi:hypothetical protein